MLLPGRLRTTTLGDLLGTIHRAGASGTLELTCSRGRSHRIHVVEGRVTAVEIDGVPHGDLTLGARRQMVQRLNQLEAALSDAQVRFRVAVRAPRTTLRDPLDAAEVLPGRRRARDGSLRPNGLRAPHGLPSPTSFAGSKTPPPVSTAAPRGAKIDERHAALHLLGLPAHADSATIKQTYRRLVRTYHPDLHPGASDLERRSLAERFSAITQAYQRLVA